MTPRGAAGAIMGGGLAVSLIAVLPGNQSASILVLGQLAGIWGGFLALVAVLLAARVPMIEGRLGHTHALAIHRVVGPGCALLVTAHVGLTILAYNGGAGLVASTLDLILRTGWMLPAALGFLLIAALSLSSYRRVRAKISYETWWAAHLYMYLAVVLAFGHTLFVGSVLTEGRPARVVWVGLHAAALAAVLLYRIALPIRTSLRARPRLAATQCDGQTVVLTIALTGPGRLRLRNGQYMYWRVLKPGLWWQAHPYSILDATDDQIRIAVRLGGDYSRALAALKPGAAFAFEGPYGVMTARRAREPRVTLLGGGAGIAPLLGLIADLPPTTAVRMVAAIRDSDPLLELEVRRAIENRRMASPAPVGLDMLAGPPSITALTPPRLGTLAPGIVSDDVFLCGPPGFTDLAIESLIVLGVPRTQIHTEVFAT